MPRDSLFRCDRCGSHISDAHAPRCANACIGLNRGAHVVTDVPFGRCTWGACTDAREAYVQDARGVVFPLCHAHAAQAEARELFTRCACFDCAPAGSVVCVGDYRQPVWNHAAGMCNFQAGGDATRREWCQLPASVYTFDVTNDTTRGWCGLHAADMTTRFCERLDRCGCECCSGELPAAGRSMWRTRNSAGVAPANMTAPRCPHCHGETTPEGSAWWCPWCVALIETAAPVRVAPAAPVTPLPVVEPVRKRGTRDPRNVGLVVWA